MGDALLINMGPNGNLKIGLRQNLEFAFLGPLVQGQHVIFSRIQVDPNTVPRAAPADPLDPAAARLTPGGTYTFTFPMGQIVGTVDAFGHLDSIRHEIGAIPGNDAAVLVPDPFGLQNILGPNFLPALGFPFVIPGYTGSFIGNPFLGDQPITPGANGNVFQIDGPDIGGPGIDSISTPAFTIVGKLYSADLFNLIVKYYNDILGRTPEPGGAEFWESEILKIIALGIDVREGFQALAKFFFNSAEYQLRGRTDPLFVVDLYQAFLNRAPDPPGQAFWEDQLVQGLTRNMLITAFANSAEFTLFLQGTLGATTTRPENNLVNDFYRGFLNRFPDPGGFNLFLTQMRAAQCAGPLAAQQITTLSHQIALAFIQSPEYALRARDDAGFVEDLYNGILRRGADPAGFTSWLNTLAIPTPRDQVLQAFTISPEFHLRITDVINAPCLP